MNEISNSSKVLSLVVVLAMVLSGLLIAGPLVPNAVIPSSAQLDPGPDYSNADGHWDWGGSYGNEVLLEGRGASESQKNDVADVLIIVDYMYYFANPNSATDFYYSRARSLSAYIHENDYTLDTWWIYPFTSPRHSYRDGRYDSIARFNYYPSQEIMEQYRFVIVYTSTSYLYGGIFYSYENPRYSTQRETFTTLSEFLDDGGNLGIIVSSMGYQMRFGPTYTGSWGVNFFRDYVGITDGGLYRTTSDRYTYQVAGFDGTFGDSIATSFSSSGPPSGDYLYSYFYNKVNIFLPETEAAYYGSRGFSSNPVMDMNKIVAWQTLTDEYRITTFGFDPFYQRYMWPPGAYQPGIRDMILSPMIEQFLQVLVGHDGDNKPEIALVYPVEIQSTGNEDEWVELVNTIDMPVNLFDYAISTEGENGRKPSTYFGDYEDLSPFGMSANLEDQTYFLNAESLYIDRYWAPGDDSFYLYKIMNGNDYGKYYHLASSGSVTTWWDSDNEMFLTEDEKDSLTLGELEDHIYQITFPTPNWWYRHQYVVLNTGDDHKYENDQQLRNTMPGGTYLDLDFESLVDGSTPNTETQAFADYMLAQEGWTMIASTLKDYYRGSDTLFLYNDDGGAFIRSINMRFSSDFWRIQSLPYQGTIFVNDNNPETMLYYSHYTGGQVFGPGSGILEIDITDDSQFDHYTNEDHFQDESRTYGSTTVDFKASHIQQQIITRTINAPILTDMIYVNKNTGAIASGPGADIVGIPIDLMEDDNSWLFPRGATYTDWTSPSTPTRDLDHLIVVTDDESDPEGNKNDLTSNGRLHVWKGNSVEGAPIGWGTSGSAPEPAGGWSAQAYFDGSKYKFGEWSLSVESPGVDNSVPAPAYGSVDVVINEINPTYVELYNRGGSAVSLSGWRLTGEGNAFTMSGTIGPGSFKVIPETDFLVPFTPVTGGRISLFDDLGAIVSSIGYQTDVPSNSYSYAARHLDGVGTDFGYNDTMLQPWANGEAEAQQNADWDLGPERTTGSKNYEGIMILQVGAIKDSSWGLIENLSAYNTDWAGGVLGTKKLDQYYLNNWDVIFVLSGITQANSDLLSEYVMNGGRLYMEYADWTGLESTDLYNDLGLQASQTSGGVSTLTGFEPLTSGEQLAYSGTVTSRFAPNSETFRVWEEGGSTYTVLVVDIDPSDPGNSYRVVASAVKYASMSELTRGDMPVDYVAGITEYFLLSDDDVNHQPEIELIEPVLNGAIDLYKARPTLLWENNDIDVWDQVPGTMKYTLYIDTDMNKVATMDPDARSAVFVEEGSTATVVDAADAPVAGIYYWGIYAEDKYEKTTYAYSGGVFKYDSEVPSVGSMAAFSDVGMDDPLPIGGYRIFGPGYTNGQGDMIGRPTGFAVTMSDNFGLKFSNNHNTATQLLRDEYFLPTTAFSVKVLYFYGGQYEDNLPAFDLYVDMEGTNNDLESLTGMDEVTFYIIPDGPIPDGQYHFFVQAADEVRWGSYMDWNFEVDLTAPDMPMDLMIDPETYIDQFGELFLKAGETYSLSVTAPSSGDDGSMNRVEFQQAVADFEGATWETIAVDYDVSDNTYSVLWTPDTDHFYLRAIAYDYVDNFAISDVFTSFHVDGQGPEAPLTLQATLDLTHTAKARISGYVFDRIVEGQTSGAAYVVLWQWDMASGTFSQVTDDQGEIVHVPIIDYQFDHSVDLDAINGATGDRSYAFFAQAYDHVGNAGDMSDAAVWTNTNMQEDLRIISPSSIKDIPMKIEREETDDSLDEIRSITVTFLNTEQDFMNYMFTIRPGTLRTASDAAGLGLPEGTKFLYGYFNVEVPPEFSNFEAQVTIEFHVSSRSQLGTRTAEIIENIRLVAKHEGETSFEVLELIGGRAQPVDEENGIYRVQARVNRFSDFAVIVAQTDLMVKDIVLGASPAITNQEMTITVTVHNGGDFPRDAEDVKVKLFSVDPEGNQEYIGELDYGTIEPDVDYYISDPGLRKGDMQRSMRWTTTNLIDPDDMKVYTIKAQVDPDGYVRETSETNNERTTDIEIVGAVDSTDSFAATFMMLAFGVLVVSALSEYRKKRT